MKAFRYIILLLLIPMCTVAQSNDHVNPSKWINEASISGNGTISSEFGAGSLGFGLGIYHVFAKSKFYNPVIGLEFNRTSTPASFIRIDRYATVKDVRFINNMLSVPVGIRLGVGSTVKGYVELGGFIDLTFASESSGIKTEWFISDSTGGWSPKESEYSGGKLGGNAGIYAGLGLQVPVSKFTIGIKPEIRYGLMEKRHMQGPLSTMYGRVCFIFGW